ncbi:MAG: hypothetical protein ACI4VL_05715 [Bacilli bacterium]
MTIKVTYEEKEPYEIQINNDSFSISILNAIYVEQEDTTPSGTANNGDL